MPENNIVLKHIEIAKKIYKYIIDNKILKGDKLPGGRTFAVKYNVSKNTVYEALELLQADGYVVIKKDSGTFVTDKIWNTALSGSPNWDAYINNSWSHNRNEILDNVFCDESRIEDDVIYLSQDCLASKFNASLYLNKEASVSSMIAVIVKYSSGTKASISRSLSTISFKATLCTRPALFAFILDCNNLDNLKPIILSSILLVS